MRNLRQLRKLHGLTMKDVARIINVSESAISQYETGKREPDFSTLIILSEYFHVTTDYLLDLAIDSEDKQDWENNIVAIGRGGERIEYEMSNEDAEFVRAFLLKLKRNS